MLNLKFSLKDPFEVAYFRLPKWILRFLSLWPLDPTNRATAVRNFVQITVLLTAIIGEIRYTWLIRRVPIEALAAICPCLTKVVTWIKIICFVIYREEFSKLLTELFDHLQADTKDARKNAMIARVSFFTMIWAILLYFCGISTDVFYSTKPIFIWAYQRFNGINDTWVGLPFQAALPYEDMTRLQDKTLYGFMYCLLAYSGAVTIHGFPGVDGAFMCFCMYITVAQECLQEDFKQTFRRYTSDELVYKKNNVLYDELCELVKRQQNIAIMFKRFNRVYKFMIFGHFLFAGIVLGVALVDLLLTPGISKTIYVTYALGACTQLYTYCYGAECVDESCFQLSKTLYFCDWYKCDPRVRRLILFVIIKSQRGSLLISPFFSPSLPLFAAIVKTSGSYITLLQAFL